MATISQSTYLSASICLLSSWLYFLRPKRAPFYQLLTQTCLAVHTFYILYLLLVVPPRNVFSELNTPVDTPSDVLRALYRRKSHDGTLDPELDGLLKKLGSFDMRVLYIRLGHDVIATCDYCQSFTDYALLALPRPLLSYIREIAFIGVLTLPSTPRAHLRPVGMGVLMLAALTEAYWVLTAPVTISQNGVKDTALITMWHDTLLFLRHLLFLLLPLSLQLPRIPLVHSIPILSNFLPAPASDLRVAAQTQNGGGAVPIPTGPQRLQVLQRTLDHLVASLHLLKYTRAAVMRMPRMQERAAAWWDAERVEGEAGVADEGVRRTARGMGLGYDQEDGKDNVLRDSARAGVQSLMAVVPPSEHW